MTAVAEVSRVGHVRTWMADRFTESRVWIARELIAMAWRDGIDLHHWWHTEAVKGLGIRRGRRDEMGGVGYIVWYVGDTPEGVKPIDGGAA